jgi:hypothetical protein
VFVINRFLIPGSRLTLRNGRIPAGDSIPQSIPRFFFKALAMSIAIAGSVPADQAGHARNERALRNTLWQKALRIGWLKNPLIYFAGNAMLDIFSSIAAGSFWSHCQFLNISSREC